MYGRDNRREEAAYAKDPSIEQARWSEFWVLLIQRLCLQRRPWSGFPFCKDLLFCPPHGLWKTSQYV